VYLDAGLLASRTVQVNGGIPGDDDTWSRIIVRSDFTGIVEDINGLFAYLADVNNGYLDKEGRILPKLADLTDESQLVLAAAYQSKRAEIYAVLKQKYLVSVLVTTSGGLTAVGYTDDTQLGGHAGIRAPGNIVMMGYMYAGGSPVQVFDTDGYLISETIDWAVSGSKYSDVLIESSGQAFIAGSR